MTQTRFIVGYVTSGEWVQPFITQTGSRTRSPYMHKSSVWVLFFLFYDLCKRSLIIGLGFYIYALQIRSFLSRRLLCRKKCLGTTTWVMLVLFTHKRIPASESLKKRRPWTCKRYACAIRNDLYQQDSKAYWYQGPIFIQPLKQKIVLRNFFYAQVSRIPVTDCTCDMLFWLVTLFWY